MLLVPIVGLEVDQGIFRFLIKYRNDNFMKNQLILHDNQIIKHNDEKTTDDHGADSLGYHDVCQRHSHTCADHHSADALRAVREQGESPHERRERHQVDRDQYCPADGDHQV